MRKSKILQNKIKMKVIVLGLALLFVFFVPGVLGASPNDACFNGGCHVSPNPRPINQSLYDSNPHSIIQCIDCHVNSTDHNDTNHGQFIRQLNGSNITGPLTTGYYSQNFSLCYYCHTEKNVVGVLPEFFQDIDHRNPPINVSTIGTNFINLLPAGFRNYPVNIHWDHLDDFGSFNWDGGAMFDLNPGAGLNNRTSYQSCPACHNVHGTNYPKMTRSDIAIAYGSDVNGVYGYINSSAYKNPGGDVFCNGCHGSGPIYNYYRNETNVFEDCISCHVDGIPGGLQGNVNKTAFSQGVHVDINTTDGIGQVNNSDCWTCHFNRDMNKSNIRQCADCHTGSGQPDAPQAPKVRTHLPAVTNYSCLDCHSKVTVNPGAGIPNVTSHYAQRPAVPTSKYCDYCHGPNASSPFPALNKTIPRFNHDDPGWNGNATCRTCHTNSSVSADIRANNTSSFHELTTELGDAFDGTAKADCVLCHVQKAPQFVSAPNPPHDTTGMVTADCSGCHGVNVPGTQAQKLHDPTPTTTGGCIGCHSNNATRYYTNTSLFGLHANVNTSDDTGNV
ncbi:MAG: NapC/NirT family cytochrome c, partial [Candidatus Methanoperedens sp.]|nr:NapC/NirT family cytochrome c [Candidatus Methanoperedens sp.]